MNKEHKEYLYKEFTKKWYDEGGMGTDSLPDMFETYLKDKNREKRITLAQKIKKVKNVKI